MTLSTQPLIILEAEQLLIIPEQETEGLVRIKVYEWDHFFYNPDPAVNDSQIAQYSVLAETLDCTLENLKEMYAGWSRINKDASLKLVGIHNQDPQVLFIQFALGERYFIYQRETALSRETVREELFGKKEAFRLRALNPSDEQYLISNLKFIPKAKNAISFYPQSSRKHLSELYGQEL